MKYSFKVCLSFSIIQAGKFQIFWSETNKLKLHAWANWSRLNLENVCCHSVQIFLSSCLLFNSMKVQIDPVNFMWVLNLVPYIKVRTYAEGISGDGEKCTTRDILG